MSRIMRSHKTEKGVGVLVIVIILLLICLAFFGIAFASSNSDKVLNGVTINNTVEIGGKSFDEAKAIVADYEKQLGSKPYVLRFDDRTATFYGEEIGLRIDQKALQEACNIGREGNIIQNGITAITSMFGVKNNIHANVTFDENALYKQVDALVDSSGTKAEDSTYEIKTDTIDIFKGHDGVTVKYSQLRDDIQKNIESIEGSDIVIAADIERAKEIDIESLHREVYVETKDAQISSDGTYTAEQIGVDFDKQKALVDYKELPKDSKMVIKLEKHEPKITTKNLEKELFSDTLGTFHTTYNAGNTNRSTNLALAANNINGTILLPGDEFSYNKTVGERTTARGFKEAHVYSGGQVVDGLGGGICQISSTLYNAVLKADLEIVERKNHMFWPEYVSPSLDATVAWGSIDFRFKNTRKTPVKIVASAKGGTATVTIYGKKEDDEPTITLEWVKLEEYPPSTKYQDDKTMNEGETKVIQTAVKGYKSEAYKVYKDIKGKEIKREKISTDTYKATDKIIAKGTKKVATVTPEPTTTTPPVSEDNPIISSTTPGTDSNTNTNTNNNENNNSKTNTDANNGWPTGWDTPENPNYRG